jgi:hypothetical protein
LPHQTGTSKNKKEIVMSKVLNSVVAIIILDLAAMGTAHARAINYHQHYVHPGYAGPVTSSAPRILWPWYVPSHGIVGKSCGDAFQPMCKR